MSIHVYPFGTEYPPAAPVALDATLQALADLSTSANTAPYFTDIDQAALMTVTPLARTLLDDTTQAQMQATLGVVPATGEPDTVAFFDATGALFSESYFAYDTAIGHLGLGVPPGSYQLDVKYDIRAGRNLYVTTYLGIGTTSAYAPLTFSNTLQPKIYLYSSGNSRRGLSTATSEMRLFTDAHLVFGHVSLVDGISFSEKMRLADNGFLGIGTTAPTAPLSFATAVGQKIHLFASGTDRFGLGISNARLDIFAASSSHVAIGTMSTTDGVTFNPRLLVSDTSVEIPNVPVGMSTPAINGWGLRVGAYPSYFGGVITANAGIDNYGTLNMYNSHIYAPERTGDNVYAFYSTINAAGGANRWFLIHTGDAMSSLGGRVGIKTTAPSYDLEVNGMAWMTRLGVGSSCPPNGLCEIRASSCIFDNVGMGAGNVQPRWNLDCRSRAHCSSLGVYYGGDDAPNAGVDLRCYRAYFDTVGVGTGVYAGWSLAAGSIVNWGNQHIGGTMYVQGTSQHAGVSGFGYAPDGAYWIRAGSSYFDLLQSAGDMYVHGTSSGIRYTNVGSTQGLGTLSNSIAFGWGGTPGGVVSVRVDNYQAGYMTLTISDKRVKLDIQEDVPGLEAVRALRPVSHLYNQSLRPIGFPLGRHYGLIAQEAQPHVPLAVHDAGMQDGWLKIDYEKLVPVLVRAMQQLLERVERLEAA